MTARHSSDDCPGCAALQARVTEIELRYLELQREVDELSELLRQLDGRQDRAEARLALLAAEQAGDGLSETWG